METNIEGVCVPVCVQVGVYVCAHLYACVCFIEAQGAREVNECPRETTLGEKEVVGGQVEEK